MIVSTLLGLVIAGVSWWVKNIWAMVVAQQDAHNKAVLEFQKQVSNLTLELARDYVPRKELQDTFKRIFDKLEEIQDEVRKHPT